MMTAETLRGLDDTRLADYVWRRLRREEPLDPPLGVRFGDEPPEQFLSVAAKADTALRSRLIGAIRENLRRLVVQRAAGSLDWNDPGTDEQIASLAFLASMLEADELVDPLYEFLLAWPLRDEAQRPVEWTSGRFHLLRTLAKFTQRPSFARFWEELWEAGPRSSRGLILFGWARACPDDALDRLGELVDMEGEVDLPVTLWSLIGRKGPGLPALAEHAARLAPHQADRICRALEAAGADAEQLRPFDAARRASPTESPRSTPPSGFPFAESTTPKDPVAARQPPRWCATAGATAV